MTEHDRPLTSAEQRAIEALDALDGNNESAHIAADAIIFAVLHPDVQAALGRAQAQTGPWWYA
jgi:hypothetical protein